MLAWMLAAWPVRDVMHKPLCRLLLSVDDLNKFGLQRGAADEESIDVGLRSEFAAVGGGDRASVLDSQRGRNFSRDVVDEPLPQGGVNFLCLCWSGGLAGADGPHWLVSDDDVSPVFDLSGDGLHLTEDDFLGLAGFAFLKGLSDAGDDLQSLGQGKGGLLSNELVRFAEDCATFGVTDDDPVSTDVLQHGWCNLAGEGA